MNYEMTDREIDADQIAREDALYFVEGPLVDESDEPEHDEDVEGDLGSSASVGVARRRCPDCGEFAENCAGHGQSHGVVREYGFGGRAIRVGED